MKSLALFLLISFAACGQETETPHQILQRVKDIGLTANTIDRAEALLHRAIQGWEQRDPRSPEYAETITLLGMVRQSRADLGIDRLRSEVEPLYRKALDVYQRSLAPPDNTAVALTLELEAFVLGTIGEVTEATPYRERAAAIRKAHVRELQQGAIQIAAAFKIGNGISAPRVMSKVEPEYTDDARIVKYQGAAILQVVIDRDGIPQDISLQRSLGFGLDEKAVQAVRTWRFQPGTDGGGQAVPVIATIEVNFRLL